MRDDRAGLLLATPHARHRLRPLLPLRRAHRRSSTRFAREHPAARAVESIGKSHEGRDIWVLTVTNTAHRARRREAGVLGRRQHPRDRGRRVGREPLLPAHAGHAVRQRRRTSRARSTRARSTSARASIPTAPNGRSPTSRSGSARSTRPYPFDEEEIEGLTVEDIDGDGRILQMRIPDPNGAVEGASGRAAAHDPARSDRDRRHLLPRPARGHASTTTTASRCELKKPPQGLDLNRNFPGELAAGIRAARRGAVSRRRSPRCARSSTSSRGTRTSPAARRSTRGAACCCARSSTCPTTRCTPRTCGSTRRRGRRARSSPAIPRSRSTTSSATTRSR